MPHWPTQKNTYYPIVQTWLDSNHMCNSSGHNACVLFVKNHRLIVNVTACSLLSTLEGLIVCGKQIALASMLVVVVLEVVVVVVVLLVVTVVINSYYNWPETVPNGASIYFFTSPVISTLPTFWAERIFIMFVFNASRSSALEFSGLRAHFLQIHKNPRSQKTCIWEKGAHRVNRAHWPTPSE